MGGLLVANENYYNLEASFDQCAGSLRLNGELYANVNALQAEQMQGMSVRSFIRQHSRFSSQQIDAGRQPVSDMFFAVCSCGLIEYVPAT